MRIARFLVCAAAVLAFAAPAAAQDEFVFHDIPWGITPDQTTDALAPMGFVLNTEFAPDEGEVMYEGRDDDILLASFAGDALVGIRVARAAPPEQVRQIFEQTVQEGTANLGAPERPEEGVATWWLGETSFSVLMGESQNGLTFLSFQYGGPGFEDEIARRTGGAAPLPALDARWGVVWQNEEQRISFDRTTVRPAGGGAVRAWIRNDYAVPETRDGVRFDRSMDQIEYDCQQLRYRIFASTYHLGEQVVGSESPAAPSDWASIVPETVGEDILAAVCGAGA